MYKPLWINPINVDVRSINDGDMKIYNKRGAVLAGAYLMERLMSGFAYIDYGTRCDWIIPGKLDRGGAINLISPTRIISRYCAGQSTSSYLVKVEKVSTLQMKKWREQYPDAFLSEYDPASGLRFSAWIEKGV